MYQNSTDSKPELMGLDMKKLMQRSLKSHCYQINLSNVQSASIARKWTEEGYMIKCDTKTHEAKIVNLNFYEFSRSYYSVCNSPVRFHKGDSISSSKDRLTSFYDFYGMNTSGWCTALQHLFFL